MSIDKRFKELKGKLDFKYPMPMRTPREKRDKSRFCEFYNEYEHDTRKYKNLAWEIETLVRSGKLKDYLKDGRRPEKVARIGRQIPESPEKRKKGERTPQVIHVIHVETDEVGVTPTKRKRKL